jgi:hypothetical protein
MNEKEKLRLEEIYSKMPDAELGEMFLCDQSEYTEGIYDLVSAEAKKRGLDKTKINEIIEKKKSELPFSWGKFIIVMCFVQGLIALIGGMFGMGTEYIPYRVVSIIIGGASLSSAYGLIARKRWGLNILMFLFYIGIPICILLLILGISKVNSEYIVQGIGGGIATVLNIIYFRKRKYMFTSGELSQPSVSSDVSFDTVVEPTLLEPKLVKEEPTKKENMQSYVTNSEAKEKSYEPSGYGQKLRELKKIKDEGLLTDEEYEIKRKAIVDDM